MSGATQLPETVVHASRLAPPADPNEFILQVGDTNFQGWQSVSATLSCERLPNSFAVTASTEFLQNNAALAGIQAGQACTILIGNDVVITGRIDRCTFAADASNHTVTIAGRGLCRNLVDCSVDIVNDASIGGGSISATSTLDLAQRLSKAYGITCRSAVADLGVPIPAFQVALGESPSSIIESVCHYAGFLYYEDETGALVIDRVGTKSMASGFTMPGNIEAISAERSVDQLFSQYCVVWGGVYQLQEFAPLGSQFVVVKDETVLDHRVRIITTEQNSPVADPALNFGLSRSPGAVRASWELACRRGRSQAASITCDSWRDTSGKLWTPNYLAPIQAPACNIVDAHWIIGTVTFRKDASGTHADLVLMPPDAFDPQPNPSNLFNDELLNAPQKSQTPAPPGTDAPLGTPPT